MLIAPGLSYLFVLNDRRDETALLEMIEGFDRDGVSAVALHPRSGLLVPYGGDDWFDMIRWIVERCAERDIDVWLYDEDPFPSGAAGGRLVAEQPQFQAHEIVRHVARDGVKPGELFTFAADKLLWCGHVDKKTGRAVDLTSKVGMVRLDWEVLPEWDSRFYYPQTPVYDCPRAWTHGLQYALQIPEVPAEGEWIAFTAKSVSEEQTPWGHMPDTLNPDCTKAFLGLVHEKYHKWVGEHFGQTIKAVFIDEPHVPSSRPWTPGMFESFANRYGYELGPRLWHLFEPDGGPDAMVTRIHLREWLGNRFEEAWLKPVAAWTRSHGLGLVGHISPEDDPVQQANIIGNLLPRMKQMTIPGIDVIIPAVGDDRHGLLNLGILSARSIAEQQDREGVLSESLALTGTEPDMAVAARVLRWQTVMGLTAPVLHAAYTSMRGHRAIDAPPDWGPRGGAWDAMCALGLELAPWQRRLTHATQVAPVALLWPIRSFAAESFTHFEDYHPLREGLADLVLRFLDRQIGIHLLDEADLWDMSIDAGHAALGRARYSHVVCPQATVWDARTIDKLRTLADAGVQVSAVSPQASWVHAGLQMERMTGPMFSPLDTDALDAMPQTVDCVDSPGTNLRCTRWIDSEGETFELLIDLGTSPRAIDIDGTQYSLQPGAIYVRQDGNFEPIDVSTDEF